MLAGPSAVLTCELEELSSPPERREAGLSWFLIVCPLGDVVVMLDCRNVFKLKAGHRFESTLLVLGGWKHPVNYSWV